MKIIITGSEGLIGKELVNHLQKNHQILKLDLSLGHDLTDEKFVKSWFKKNKANSLINCFAMNDHVDNKRKKQTLFNIPLDSFSNYLNVNLIALFSVCREFARNNKKGSIVNFSATTGIVSARPDLYNGSHKHIGYSVSKAGVINLTKYLATHLGPSIRVNCVAPGGVKFKQDSNFIKKYSKHTPLGRMMKKNELNSLIEFLSSENSSYVTGAVMVIDGGWTIW
ncbi:MAG: dehydrogenase [Chloroflexi bacterium]|nr:dehydrogenase [Chloroflexota bacterium]|tara:strand:+ start:4164 stop:4835 length:672 start_codon:yes stop_codon:yes gene_type:complete